MTAGETNFAIIFVIAMLFMYMTVMGIALTDYIIRSMSLYTLANRRGISNPWLAWIPLGSSWIIGSIVDCHDRQQGIDRKWRVALVALSCAIIACYILYFIFLFVFIFAIVIQFSASEPSLAQVFGMFIPIYLFVVVVMMVALAYSFCQFICLYKIYEVTSPQKAVKYIILSLIVPLAGAICLMKCRNSLYGIPQPVYSAPVSATEYSNHGRAAEISAPTADNTAEVADASVDMTTEDSATEE